MAKLFLASINDIIPQANPINKQVQIEIIPKTKIAL